MDNEFNGLNLDTSPKRNDPGTTIVPRGDYSRPISNFTGVGIFGVILLFLVCFALVRMMMGYEPIYFSSFLDILTNAPKIDFTTSFQNLSIPGPWPILDGFRCFLNLFCQLFSFLIYIVNGLVNICSFLFYLIGCFIGIA